MLERAWQRPSLFVAGTALLWLGVFAASGRLSLGEPAQQEATVDASKVGTRPAAEPTVVRVGRSAPIAPRVEVRGTVLDASGFLVVGAEVTGRDGAAVRTGAAGEFVLALPSPGPHAAAAIDLRIAATGQRSQWLRGSLVSPDPTVVRLSPSAPWDASVAEPTAAAAELFGEGFVHGPDGRPVVGAFVTVHGSGVWAKTDELGRYSLPLSQEAVVLVVHQPEAGPDGHGLAVRSQPFTPQRSHGIVPLPELVAEPGALLRGRVADSRGEPIVGVPVEVRGEGIMRVLESGMSGIFRLAGLLPGRYEVRPFPHRGAFGPSQSVQVEEGVAECQVALNVCGERRIRVLDEQGQPVPRAHLASNIDGARCGVAQADQEGWASLRVADQRTEWEVRSTVGLAPLPVRQFEPEAGTIVVALP